MGGDRVLLGRDVCLWEVLWAFCWTRGSWWCCPTGLCVVGDGRCHTWGGQWEFCRLQVSQAAVRRGCVHRCLACPPVGAVALSGQGPNPASHPDPCHREPLPHVGGCHGDGRHWGDLWWGLGGSPLTPPITCLGSPPAPQLRREGSWGAGRGQSTPGVCVGWVLAAALRGSWYGNMLASRSCRGRC